MSVLTVENLTKAYGKIEAVRGISFQVESGRLFAFLGPNGAGKSTTIDILCTLLQPGGGRVTVGGHVLGREDGAIRREIGVVFQESILDPLLTVRENLTLRAHFYRADRQKIGEAVREAAAAADVTELLDRPYGKLSGGQRRRTDIARALLNAPKILFLDEPTTGLDPRTRESVWQTVSGLQKRTGMTVFLTTHYLEEAAGADEVVVIDRGVIAAQGSPYDLQERYSSDKVRLKARDREAVAGLLKEEGLSYVETNGLFSADVPDTVAAIPLLCRAKPYLEGFEVVHGSLEDAFLRITGGGLHD